MASPYFFNFGFGYVASALARNLQEAGWQVGGTTRDRLKRRELQRAGFDGCGFDEGEVLPRLERADALLLSVPPGAEGDPVRRRYGEALARMTHLRWIGYLSITGVYGDRQGGWVSEQDAPNPESARARRRFEAEQGWRRLAERHGLPLHVFRLPGIYGPGRNVLKDLGNAKARRIDKPGHVFSRVHVQDIASALQASLASERCASLFNVADDLPSSHSDMVAYGAALLGMEPPVSEPFETATLSPMLRSFYASSRRVSNALLKEDLGWSPRYSSYREGLQALLQHDERKTIHA